MSKNKKKKKIPRENKHEGQKRILFFSLKVSKFILTFILGVVCGPYVIQFYVGHLQEPNIKVNVQGISPVAISPEAKKFEGCTFYYIFLKTEEPIDNVYLKIQFPEKITGYKVGFIGETLSTKGINSVLEQASGRNDKGECDILKIAMNPAGVEYYALVNMLTIRYSKLIPKTVLAGAVATTHGDSAPLKMYTIGEYEYTKLGQVIRKPLKVQASPVLNVGLSDQIAK